MVSPMAMHIQITAGRSLSAVDDRYIRRKAARIISKVSDLPDTLIQLLGIKLDGYFNREWFRG
jgi:hypothetical protein